MTSFHAGFCDDFAGQAADGVFELLILSTCFLGGRQGLGHCEGAGQQQQGRWQCPACNVADCLLMSYQRKQHSVNYMVEPFLWGI